MPAARRADPIPSAGNRLVYEVVGEVRAMAMNCRPHALVLVGHCEGASWRRIMSLLDPTGPAAQSNGQGEASAAARQVSICYGPLLSDTVGPRAGNCSDSGRCVQACRQAVHQCTALPRSCKPLRTPMPRLSPCVPWRHDLADLRSMPAPSLTTPGGTPQAALAYLASGDVDLADVASQLLQVRARGSMPYSNQAIRQCHLNLHKEGRMAKLLAGG